MIRRILIVTIAVLLVIAIIGVIWGIVHLVGERNGNTLSTAVSSKPVSSISPF